MGHSILRIQTPLLTSILPWQDFGARRKELPVEDLMILIFHAQYVLQPSGVLLLISDSFCVCIQDGQWLSVSEQQQVMDSQMDQITQLWLHEMKTVRAVEIEHARMSANHIKVRSKPNGNIT